jgi:hypothetical protein
MPGWGCGKRCERARTTRHRPRPPASRRRPIGCTASPAPWPSTTG